MQQLNIPRIPLKPGELYTSYSVSDSAMTTRTEFKVVTVLEVPEFRPDYLNAPRGKWRLGTIKIGLKRTLFHLDVRAAGTLFMPGTGHLLADHEAYNSWAMSATLNIAGSPEAIRELVGKNINPHFAQHDRIIAYPERLRTDGRENGILVYPEVESDHAVILRMRETSTPSEG
ncbi:MAG: hypothetical protein EON58_12085 [Alphaproteobacteria bacterium]|nr:MAG: hypothetical protein EON58_12085 [Alphaproteobacteria bacterium]